MVVIKGKYLEMGKLSWIIHMGPILSQEPLKREEGAEEWVRKKRQRKEVRLEL